MNARNEDFIISTTNDISTTKIIPEIIPSGFSDFDYESVFMNHKKQLTHTSRSV